MFGGFWSTNALEVALFAIKITGCLSSWTFRTCVFIITTKITCLSSEWWNLRGATCLWWATVWGVWFSRDGWTRNRLAVCVWLRLLVSLLQRSSQFVCLFHGEFTLGQKPFSYSSGENAVDQSVAYTFIVMFYRWNSFEFTAFRQRYQFLHKSIHTLSAFLFAGLEEISSVNYIFGSNIQFLQSRNCRFIGGTISNKIIHGCVNEMDQSFQFVRVGRCHTFQISIKVQGQWLKRLSASAVLESASRVLGRRVISICFFDK